MSTQPWILTVALALAGLAGACAVDLEDELEGQPCVVADDCWRTQECNQTPEEELYNLPGSCQPEGTGCIPGHQLGCSCNPSDPSLKCLSAALPSSVALTYPSMVCDPVQLRCVLAPPGGAP